MRITSNPAQQIISESKNIRSQMMLARTTENTDIQEDMSGSKNMRVLRSLASNPNLGADTEIKLAKMDDRGINRALLNRRAA